MPKITKRTVDQLKPSETSDQFVWDWELRGFGIRVKRKSGAASYFVNYRTPEGRQRRLAFAKLGTLTPDEARRMARGHFAAIAGGADPSGERHQARATMTVGDLCDRYVEAADAGLVMTRFGRPKRSSTIQIDRGRVSRHIKPCIGQIAVTKLTRAGVQRMCDRFNTSGLTRELQELIPVETDVNVLHLTDGDGTTEYVRKESLAIYANPSPYPRG